MQEPTRNVSPEVQRAIHIVFGLFVVSFFMPLIIGLGVTQSLMSPAIFFSIIALIVLAVLFIRQINQYERGVMLSFGMYSGTKNPGWRIVIPIVQQIIKVDMRIAVIDVPDQDAITRDNISVNVNAVVYYKVKDARAAVLEIENFKYAISQLAQTTMRDVVGEMELDELLANRDQVSAKIREIVDKASDPWGISVVSVDLKHVELPQDLKRTIGKQAEAERERRAVIIKAEGEVASAQNMAEAARILGTQPGALHLRTLQSVNDISSDQSNTIVFAMPLEILRAFERVSTNDK
jgi:regulator of protease activity HflC (stomatin/prohibitin superfamily)